MTTTWKDRLIFYEGFLARECRNKRQYLRVTERKLRESTQDRIVNYTEMETEHRPWPSNPYEMEREALIKYALKLFKEKCGLKQKEADLKMVRSQLKHDR